jgi:hypothetical protein
MKSARLSAAPSFRVVWRSSKAGAQYLSGNVLALGSLGKHFGDATNSRSKLIESPLIIGSFLRVDCHAKQRCNSWSNLRFLISDFRCRNRAISRLSDFTIPGHTFM